MNTLSFSDIYNKIIRKVISAKWLEKWNIDKHIVNNYIRSEVFSEHLKNIIENKTFTAKVTVKLCLPVLNTLSNNYEPEDWLMYLYQYTLNKNFPETTTINFLDKLNPSCELYLRIFTVLCEAEKNSSNKSWQSRYPLEFLSLEEEKELEYPEEYRGFVRAFKDNYTYEMMKLNGEVTGYNTLDHICGVHYLSMFIARQVKILGMPVDLGRVSGAAAGHDIGKYGCKGAELKRVPHLHYYYTDQWFKKRNIDYIANIAVNHSTWDLELENLSLESLLLIYSDFRIKNQTISGTSNMTLFSLEEAFHVILNKLENVDEKKIKRYKKVYSKLKDFEDFLLNLGVDIDPKTKFNLTVKPRQNYALLQGDLIVENVKYLSIYHNINLMHQLRDEYSLDAIIELARSEKDWKNLREYIRIFQEYSTYLTQNQKLKTIRFLYENLVHPEDDVRRHCAELIGTLIAILDEDYRKEIPEKVKLPPSEINSIELFAEYFHLMLNPSHKVIPSHRFNIGYSISIMVKAIFQHCRKSLIDEYRKAILTFYKDDKTKSLDYNLFLIESAKHIPLDPYHDELKVLFNYIYSKLKKRSVVVRLAAIETAISLTEKLPRDHYFIDILRNHFVKITKKSNIISENLLLLKINKSLSLDKNINIFKNHCQLSKKNISDIFLSNLKTSTDWIKKRNQVELLLESTIKSPQSNGLHTAIHFCNLLKVSAIENVRNRAGESILRILPHLSLAERNEVSVELLRALELEGNKFTEYIPIYSGQSILWLQPKELDEVVNDLIFKIKTSNVYLKSLILKTIGVTISNYPVYRERFAESKEDYLKRLKRMLGILLNGLGNSNPQVKQSAFSVIGKDLFGVTSLDLKEKEFLFKLISKKVLTLITGKDNEELLFLTRSASLNNIYRFISDFTFFYGKIEIPLPKKVAFFPGTFDPFSLSHKEISKYIRDLGFEVYLAVDEFSWSKKTLPSLLRRNIVNMSISDELDIYIYPDNYPTNISNPWDLKLLKDNFPNSSIYISVGSDVVVNASSYKAPKVKNSIHSFSHIIFERGKSKKFENSVKNIDGDVLVLTLSSKYAEISSTQIRNYIDENKDISSLIDPMAEQYIYKNGFYQRESQDKSLIKSLWLDREIIDLITGDEIDRLAYGINDTSKQFKALLKNVSLKPSSKIILLRNTNNNEILGFSIFHRLPSSTFYEEFKKNEISQYIRENSAGRILLIDGIFIKDKERNKDLEQILLTETLALSIAKDYEYAIYHNAFGNKLSSESLYNLLKLQGFIKVPCCDEENPVYAVNMSNPCILNLDIQNIIKDPFRNDPRVKETIFSCRRKLQEALTKLYPGELILSFDVNFVYQCMIRTICHKNKVPTEPLVPKKLGAAMCVPYGDILDRYVIPNTVTKALHTEKLFLPNMKGFKIAEFPHYLDLKTQVKMIKSFNRPVILVDNLLHKGYRIKALDPIFKAENVNIENILVGVLSGRGKDLMDMQHRDVDSVYFIPRLKLWFNENELYPFIGGNSLWRGAYSERNLLPSINLIFPYTYPHFIRKTSKAAIYNLSKVSLENSLKILEVIEDEYHIIYEKNLSIRSLGKVFTTPRCPDYGNNVNYDLNLNASNYLKNDIELLLRLHGAFD